MEGWKKDKLGNLLELVYGKSLPKSKRVDGNIPVHGSNGIVGFHNVAIVNEPGIIVGRKGSAGKVHISKVPFCPIDTTFYITQQYSKLDLEYLYYALNFLDLKRILGDVGVPGLNREMAYFEELFYPPDKAEQRKIAHVLSTVQKAIEQQDNLIRTTIELKKALMQKLFTEGTRGEPQKETEIGLVPESWEVVRIGDIMKITSGGTPSRKNKEYYKGDIFWVKSGELEDNIILNTEEKITEQAIKESSAKLFPLNTLLIAMYGATVGKTSILKKEAATNQAVCAIVPNEEIFNQEFLRHFFITIRENLLKQRYGGAQPNISQTIIKNTFVPIPNVKEQNAIADSMTLFDSRKPLRG